MPLFVLALLLLAAAPASANPSCSVQFLRQVTQGCESVVDRRSDCTARMMQVKGVCDLEGARLGREVETASDAQAAAMRARVRAFQEAWRGVQEEAQRVLDAANEAQGRAPTRLPRDQRFDYLDKRVEERWPPTPTDGGNEDLALPPSAPEARERVRTALQNGDVKGVTVLVADLARSGRDGEAREALDALLAADGGSVEANVLDAHLQLKAGRAPEALAAAERVLALDPGNKQAREIRSYVLGRSGQMKGATKLPDFGGAVPENAPGAAARGGDRAGGSSGMGGGFAGGGGFARDAGAGPAASRSPQEKPAAAPASPYQQLLATARRKLGMGDLTGALFDCTRAISADPSDAEGWKLRAHINNRLGQHDAALRDAEEALRLAPGDIAARLEKVYALIGLGRFAEALAEADSVLKEAPGNALAHLYRGMALIKLGRVAEGEAALDEAVRLDPSLRALADPLRSKKAAPAPSRRVDPRKGLYVLCGLMALLLLLEGSKRVFKPGWRTTAARPETEAPAPTGTLPPGTMLGGNYRVERELARGGMGVVYRAQDVTLRRPVAIKQMRTGVPEIERFLREARLAAKLRHQNLAQIFSVIDAGRQPFLVFEFVEGEALDALLKRRGPLTLEEAVALLSPLAAALDYAHAQKVIHRDLKPANVMLSTDGVPKLMDFGIAHEARSAHGETRTEAWGTPPYMAPEQESGVVSRQSDLYALAVMAYELLTGKLPFQGMADKINRNFVRPPDPRLAAVFEKAFDPLPAGRPETAAALLASLRACLPAR
jgi:tetratricopeptide (TPR) repeat protein